MTRSTSPPPLIPAGDRSSSVRESLVARAGGEANVARQIRLARRLQSSKALRSAPTAAASLAGSGKVVLLVLCALFWRAAPGMGWLPTTAAALVVSLTGVVKAVGKGPRPYWVDDHRLETLDPTLEVSFGFPSGHTAATVAVYGLVVDRWSHVDDAARANATWALLALVAVVAFSRVFTAAHFVHDVVGGAALGHATHWLVWLFDARLASDEDRAAWLAAASVLTFVAVVTQFPPTRNVPFKLVQESVSGAGFCMGLAAAHLLEARLVPSRALRGVEPLPLYACAAGVLGIAAVDRLNKRLYAGKGDLSRARLALVSATYSLIIVWALYLLPIIVAVWDEDFARRVAGARE